MKKSSTWTKEDLKTLRRLYPKAYTRAIAVKLNKSYQSVKSKAFVLRLEKEIRSNPQQLTAKEIAFIKKNYLKYTLSELANRMGRGQSTVQSYITRLGLKGKENAGRFKEGIVPWSAGKKMPPGWGGATRFQKGQLPKNTKSDGYLSVRKAKGRPYVWIRIRLNYWRELHRVMWEKTMGPIPKGYNVQFKDKNSLNCEPSNLYLIDRHNQIMQNTIHRYPPEVKSLIRLEGKLKRKIKSYEEQD